MSWFFCFIIFLFGLAVGSFLNCIVYRLEKKQSFLKGRSFCPYCKHTLAWQDLIPVVSFFILKGRCRYCHKKISWQYPLVELASGMIFLLIFYFQQPIFYFLITPFLLIIFVYDLKHFIIPDKVIYPAIAIALIYNLLNWSRFSFDVFWAALGAAGFFLAIVLLSKGKWMGVGDIKLAFLMGLILGCPNVLVALFFAFLAGAIMGIGLIALGRKSFKSEVPFGPFLVGGTFLAMFCGQSIVKWYLNLL